MIKNEYILILHGLGRTKHSMRRLEKYLQNYGYVTINIGYPSRKYSIEYLANNYLKPILNQYANKASKIHFIGHSLGCVLIRYCLKKHKPVNLGRVVMLAPPNQGSELADFMQKLWFARCFFGSALFQLGTKNNSIPMTLGDVNFELGIIAGDHPLWMTSHIIPGSNDGIISVESTKVHGMQDFLLEHCYHTFIMRSTKVIKATCQFLKTGSFG